MTKTISSFIVLILGSALLAPPASAVQGRGRGQANKPFKVEAKQKNNDRRPGAVAFDRKGHARIIHDYVRAGALPPGLAKRDALPPGLAKQLRERGELPPGLQKHLVAVPGFWERRLPAVPPDYRRYFAGDDLVIVDTRTNRIALLIRDALR